jgi:ribonuclease PH
MKTATKRIDGRSPEQIRDYKFERDFIKTAEGSVLVSCGDTKVIVTAKVDKKIPDWLKRSANPHGWLTAEYSMLPGSCADRVQRERKSPSGRSSEIQRLIGRALRAMVDLNKLPELTIAIDCDVIQADGGTRTASITGAYVAVYDCLRQLQKSQGFFAQGLPLLNQVAAISAGIKDGVALLDLNYSEDSSAQADANFVLTCEMAPILYT